MTKKNESAKKNEPANRVTRPAPAEVGTLDQGVIIIKNVIDPTKVCPKAATERRTG